jgi:glutaredoxin-like protein NrdH
MLTFYTKKPCVQCNATQRWLDREGLVEGEDYRKVDMTDTPSLVEEMKGMGYLAAPILVPDAGEGWSGFDPDRLGEWYARA